jgi:hypothetical protein
MFLEKCNDPEEYIYTLFMFLVKCNDADRKLYLFEILYRVFQ